MTEITWGVLKACCYICGPSKLRFTKQYGWYDEGTNRYVINWREQLVCDGCGLNSRMRATVHILDTYSNIAKDSQVYITEQSTKLFSTLRSLIYSNLVGSEYLGAVCPLGKEYKGMRNEDMTHLTFADDTLSGVLSFDVLEHIPDYRRALVEVYRCLQPGAEFIFSAPFNPDSIQTLLRAEVLADGSIHHLLPPEYHGDPLNAQKGILCFQTFGWDLLADIKSVGFENVRGIDYWSNEYGYLGQCILFMARKPR